jgi:uncharacterized protein DUF3788
MLANAFIGAAKQPTDKELAAKLAGATVLWDDLIAGLKSLCDGAEWGSSSKKLGWSLRMKRKDRIIVYLSPSQGCFLASFALGDKAMQAARSTDLPALIMKILKDAKRYAEGSAVRIEVHAAADVESVLKLAKLKVEN